MRNSQKQENQLVENLLAGMGEVYQMNQSHNDDVTTVNGRWSDD